MTTDRDIRNQIAFSREEWFVKGCAKGKAEVAKALEKLGIDADIIRKATGASS